MKLFIGPTTPFGRMVEVAALEAGINLDVQTIVVTEAAFLDGLNPLRLIPTLVLDDGSTVYDSRVILRTLIEVGPGADLWPDGFDRRFETRLALVCGIMDAGVARQGEVSRPAERRHEAAIQRLEDRIQRGLAWLEAQIEQFTGSWPRLDALGTVVLLDYIDYRITSGWREQAPGLAALHEEMAKRLSMVTTRFPRKAGQG